MRFVPVLALLVALAGAGAAVIAFTGGDSSPGKKQEAAKPAKNPKKSQKPKQSATGAAPAPAPAPAPTQTESSPAPSGTTGTSGAALNNQGFSLIQQGRYAEAVPILQKAVQAFPAGTSDINYQYALYNLGHALRLAGRPAEAIPVLEQRLKYPDQQDTVKAELQAAKKAAKGKG